VDGAGRDATGPGGRAEATAHPTGERGQAAVELALVLPLLALLALLLLQVALVVRDQVLVAHAAREAAREAAVDADPARPRAAALAGARLDPDRLEVEVRPVGSPSRQPGGRIEAIVRYRSPTDVPLVGALVGDVRLAARVAMRVES
jgi:hypothetical protein